MYIAYDQLLISTNELANFCSVLSYHTEQEE